MNTVRQIEVRTPGGNPILTLHFVYQPDVPSTQSEPSNGATDEHGSRPSNGDPMTDSQKRYLFRLLAEQGVEEDRAHDELKQMLKVHSLKDACKFDASIMIKRLLGETEQERGGQ